MLPVVCGRKAGCGTGSVKGTGSTGGIERLADMKMFPVFPDLFPVCSQSQPNEFFVFSVFWIAATTHVDVVPSLLPYIQPPGTLGTALSRRKLGSNLPWNKTENTGNTPWNAAQGHDVGWMAAQRWRLTGQGNQDQAAGIHPTALHAIMRAGCHGNRGQRHVPAQSQSIEAIIMSQPFGLSVLMWCGLCVLHDSSNNDVRRPKAFGLFGRA